MESVGLLNDTISERGALYSGIQCARQMKQGNVGTRMQGWILRLPFGSVVVVVPNVDKNECPRARYVCRR